MTHQHARVLLCLLGRAVCPCHGLVLDHPCLVAFWKESVQGYSSAMTRHGVCHGCGRDGAAVPEHRPCAHLVGLVSVDVH